MDVSIIIVSYKVPYFLEQAIRSILNNKTRFEYEIIVVDNFSQDGTISMVQSKFPDVSLIPLKENLGFSRANNMGLAQANGTYILFLNPDTVLQEDTIDKSIEFMQSKENIGGMGVKMIDGSGQFLPESKRGFPSPEVAFYKAFGFSKFFPRSKRFNTYHLGYLDMDEVNQVDVLSGAFFMVKASVVREVGGWDEQFFMYGEDIDLSYRITQKGYKNYYFPGTTIIHYKGESTKKGSLNYVKAFYEAMIIFAKKHMKGSLASFYVQMLYLAVYLRAGITLLSNWTRRISLLSFDMICIYVGLFYVKNIWEIIRFDDPGYYDYDQRFFYINFPLYVIIWVFTTFLRGGYDPNARNRHVMSGIFLGTIIISAIYAFFPQELRFSRMLILLGSIWAFFVMHASRSIRSLIQNGSLIWSKGRDVNLIIVGSAVESQRVLNLLLKARINVQYIGRLYDHEDDSSEADFLGDMKYIGELVHIYSVNEIVFCSKDVSTQFIFKSMAQLGSQIQYKIIPDQSEYMIGSSDKNSQGSLYAFELNFNISTPNNIRSKRMLDMLYALLMLLMYPLLFLFVRQKWGFLQNILSVLVGSLSWVGYRNRSVQNHLPVLRKSVLDPTDALSIKPTEKSTIDRLDTIYAKDYSVEKDLEIIFKSIANLGRTVD